MSGTSSMSLPPFPDEASPVSGGAQSGHLQKAALAARLELLGRDAATRAAVADEAAACDDPRAIEPLILNLNLHGRDAHIDAALRALTGAILPFNTAHGNTLQQPFRLSLRTFQPNEPINFGEYKVMLLTLYNQSSYALLVMQLQSFIDQGTLPLLLSQHVPGNFVKEAGDAYRYEGSASGTSSTHLLHAGLLLPGQILQIVFRQRMVELSTIFTVTYHMAANRYTGTADSLQPFDVYIPAPAIDDAGRAQIGRYLPFEEKRWREVCSGHERLDNAWPALSGRGGRSVLVMGELPDPIIGKAPGVVPFSPKGFFALTGRVFASTITRKRNDELGITYSEVYGGFIVAEGENCWVLHSARQRQRGTPLPRVPLSFFNAVEHSGTMVRISEQLPEIRRNGPADWSLWDTFPVFYIDDEQLHGEFITVHRAQLQTFLTLLQENSGELSEERLTFQECHYVLQYPVKRS